MSTSLSFTASLCSNLIYKLLRTLDVPFKNIANMKQEELDKKEMCFFVWDSKSDALEHRAETTRDDLTDDAHSYLVSLLYHYRIKRTTH